MTEQLTLEIPLRTDPLTCPHREPFELDGIDRCMAHDGCFVNCAKSLCGQQPECVWEPLDNSPEAVARRRAWMVEHKEQ